jgi:hypothetical protein
MGGYLSTAGILLLHVLLFMHYFVSNRDNGGLEKKK